MNLDSLKIFCDVARQRSFSRGAALNGVSQSAASQAVSQLERHLEALLIDRSKRPLALTPVGQAFFDGSRDIVDRYLALEARVRSLHAQAACNVSVASIYSVGLYDMNHYRRRFNQQHPGGTVRIEFVHPERVYAMVLNGDADLGLVSFPRSMRELCVTPWREEQMSLVCAPDHRLAGLPSVQLADLTGEDFVAFEPGLAIQRYLQRKLRAHEAEVNVVMTFDNIEAIKRGVETGSGVSILPDPTIRQEVTNGSLVGLPIRDEPLTRPMAMIHRRGREVTPAMADYMELLTKGAASDPRDDNGDSALEHREIAGTLNTLKDGLS